MTAITTLTATTVIESDLEQNTEETPLFTVIRDHHFVELPWNTLTNEERRAIYVNVFNPCGF